jgi:hypothetical protein
MTAQSAHWIECDAPGCTMYHPCDQSCPTTAIARDDCKDRGWHRVRGSDICPECWESGWRP